MSEASILFRAFSLKARARSEIETFENRPERGPFTGRTGCSLPVNAAF